MSPSYGLNHYQVDKPYRTLYRAFRGKEVDLSGVGGLAGKELAEAAYRVDRLSSPLLVTWGFRGERVDYTWLDPLERYVLERLVWDEGVNRRPFEGGSWLDHFSSIYLIGDPGIACILTITAQTAYTLYKYGPEEVRGAYENLAGIRRPLMWGATWFTEVQGGSDLGANSTEAWEEGGLWRLRGYKYFASGAGIADIALVTARPRGGRPGAKGLELFAVPRIHGGKLNFKVARLKWKSGTVSVPTGEVELDGSAAYLIGERGKGIYYTLETLMVSRLDNSFGALGIARKAYMEAYLYALERRAFGRRIIEHELVKRDLLEMEVEIEAMTALALAAARLFDDSWGDRPPYTEKYHLARLMTHIAKNMTAETAARVTSLAMELWGGIGFLHEFPVERWHREAMITPIWEGTSNIQALDMLEAMEKKGAHRALLAWADEASRRAMDRSIASSALEAIKSSIAEAASLERAQVEFRAKDLLRRLGSAIAVIALETAAGETGDEVLHEVAKIYMEYRVKGKPLPRPSEKLFSTIASLRGGMPL